MNDDPISNLSKDEFNKLCTQTLTDITGVTINDNMNYDDPAVEYLNPDINNKNRNVTRKKINTIHLLK